VTTPTEEVARIIQRYRFRDLCRVDREKGGRIVTVDDVDHVDQSS